MRNKSIKSFFAVFFLFSSFGLFAFDRPMVSGIKASAAKGSKINILWNLPENTEKPVTKLMVYRSNKPVTSFEDLSTCTYVATLSGNTTGFTDTVKDLNDYFYAVIAVTDKPYDLVMPSLNATVSGVRLEGKKQEAEVKKEIPEEKTYPKGTLRETPLPFLDLVEGMDETENKISPEARQKASVLGIKTITKAEKLAPYFFEQDMISPERGDAYLLFDILSRYFAPRKYKDAVTQLTKLTSRNIEEDVENRALFYLGEALYYTGDYENAVRTFVKIQDVFPVQSQKWLEASLDRLDFVEKR